MAITTLGVDLGDRQYPIYIGSQFSHTDSCGTRLSQHIHGKQVCIVTNTTIAPLYLETLKTMLGTEYAVSDVILPDGESYKNLDTLNKIFDTLLSEGHNRTTTLIALGGGVIGDMTGFAAACYQRGVAFIQIPTTLLSQVDSSVGGKTGVNHTQGKNMIGAFYQPQAVIADTDVLKTLPPRELSAGLAEVIKYGLINDLPFFEWLEDNMDALVQCNPEALTEAILRSCDNKARIVAEDEKEHGVRALLNLGHTFGHAIETEMGYGEWLHGEAVGTGMVMAADLSHRMGWLTKDEKDRAHALIQRANLPLSAPNCITNEAFIQRMSVDKKVLDGRLRLILLRGIGRAEITSDVDIRLLHECLDHCKC